MLMDKMRQGAQSLTAKVIFSLIMISFALAGIGGYAVRKPNTDPAEVNGVTIDALKFDMAYRQQKQNIQRQTGEHFQDFVAGNPNFLNQLRRQVLNNMIDNMILDQRALKVGFRVSDEEVKRIILNDIDAFKVDGKFNNEQYLNVLSRYGYTSGTQFANDQKLVILDSLYQTPFQNSQFSLPYETNHFLALQKQERLADVYQIKPEKIVDQVKFSQEDLKKYYDSHSSDYVQTEQVKIDYVLVSKTALMDSISVSNDEVSIYYEDNKSNYLEKSKYHVEHLFVNASKDEEKEQAKKKVDEAVAKLKEGEIFETVVSQYSDDIITAQKGGDLGWQFFGTLEPEFENAVKALNKDNPISDVIETKYGYHIVKFIDIKPESYQSMESVFDSIVEKLKSEKIEDIYNEKVEQLTNLSNEIPDDLAGIAKELGVEVQHSNLFDANTTVSPFNNKTVISTAFSQTFRDDGLNSDAITIDNSNVIVFRVAEYKPQYTKSFDDVKASVEKDYKLSQSKTIASAKLDELNDLVKNNDSKLKSFLSENNVDVKSDTSIKRTDSSFDPNVIQKVFELSKDVSVYNSVKVVGMDDNNYLVVLKDVKEYVPSEKDLDSNELINSQLKQLNSYRDVNLLTKQLRSDADVEINEYALKQYANSEGMSE